MRHQIVAYLRDDLHFFLSLPSTNAIDVTRDCCYDNNIFFTLFWVIDKTLLQSFYSREAKTNKSHTKKQGHKILSLYLIKHTLHCKFDYFLNKRNLFVFISLLSLFFFWLLLFCRLNFGWYDALKFFPDSCRMSQNRTQEKNCFFN